MEKLDLKPLLGHLCSAVGHQVINSLSTMVSQGEVLRTLSHRGELGTEEGSERIETMVRTALEASTITRRLIDLSHDLTSINQASTLWPTEDIDLVPLVTEFVAAEKDALGPPRAGPSIWPRATDPGSGRAAADHAQAAPPERRGVVSGRFRLNHHRVPDRAAETG